MGTKGPELDSPPKRGDCQVPPFLEDLTEEDAMLKTNGVGGDLAEEDAMLKTYCV